VHGDDDRGRPPCGPFDDAPQFSFVPWQHVRRPFVRLELVVVNVVVHRNVESRRSDEQFPLVAEYPLSATLPNAFALPGPGVVAVAEPCPVTERAQSGATLAALAPAGDEVGVERRRRRHHRHVACRCLDCRRLARVRQVPADTRVCHARVVE
jgi:hypothetical protein